MEKSLLFKEHDVGKVWSCSALGDPRTRGIRLVNQECLGLREEMCGSVEILLQ